MNLESLFAFLVASGLIGLAPGPDNIFVLTQSALYGRKSGVIITLGLCIGLIAHTVAVALGVAAIFQTSTIAFNALKPAVWIRLVAFRCLVRASICVASL